jgi:hypothetical protein
MPIPYQPELEQPKNFDELVKEFHGKAFTVAKEMLNSSSQLSIKEQPARRTTSDRAIGGVGVELQHHFSPEVKARLTQIVDRLAVDGFGHIAFGLDNIEAVNQLAATDLEQRVTSALGQGLISLAQIVNHLGILFLQIEQTGAMSEQRIVCLEQLAVDLRDLAHHLVPVAQLDGSIAQILSQAQGSHGGAD